MFLVMDLEIMEENKMKKILSGKIVAEIKKNDLQKVLDVLKEY